MMMSQVLWAFILLQIVSIQCFINRYPKLNLGERDNGDPGKPLFLTPYIEAGHIEEGRTLSRVPLTESFGIGSYAGYFTVNKKYDSNLFFWYFEPMVPFNDCPVIVWLQGGPGASSLFGLFDENGPITVRDEKIELRETNWALYHHVIYIDNPVGTGFSFTNDSKGYCTDETQVGEQLYSALTQFFQLFPQLQEKRFFVTGESYGGKYVPALAYAIHKNNPTANVKINLQGIAIGDGWSDPVNQLEYGKYLYQIGLIDWNEAQVSEEYESKIKEYIRNEKYYEANFWTEMLMSFLELRTGSVNIYNYLHTKDYLHDFTSILKKSHIRKGLHVGDLEFNNGDAVYDHLQHDVMQSVAPWISELLDHYRVLIYSGQLDIIVAYPLTVNYLRNLNFTGAEAYEMAKRSFWMVDEEVAGYVKEAGNLTEILVRNAGHMVPTDQPKWALDMITRFTYGSTFDSTNDVVAAIPTL